ncbi:MAG: hypothetical protein ACTHWW_09210 [Arthrobacter sp.]|uniref:hypothetical protein n=1 Tax=unclassified Arthrobacter TaxID=235627 RepID=UPI0026510B4C|nr:hypothetical protein [Micrococcaceae bacterium]MDN5813543.1 hypothetical protein [Micrococcaceae bacterium]MDN5824493.1 hypothetical protein [Micrococcaceae bacterium]MDN5880165.1 hypothetical protein [Micrococcaceae bacterium]MDN5887573.1 hypothetical protein [Micrococcaceae bacterium]
MSQRVTVTLTEPYAGRSAEVAGQLATAGMIVERVLPALSMITGTIAAERMAGLEAIGGVASVTAELIHRLPDPDSGIQ